MRFCSECGNLLVEGALFCSECGTRINKQHESQSFSSDEENQQSKPIQNDQDGTPSQEDHDNRPFDSEQNNNVNEPFNKQQYLSQSDEPPTANLLHGTNHQNVPSGGEPPVRKSISRNTIRTCTTEKAKKTTFKRNHYFNYIRCCTHCFVHCDAFCTKLYFFSRTFNR